MSRTSVKSRRVSGLPVTIRSRRRPGEPRLGGLPRERGDDEDRQLSGAGVVERPGADEVEAVGVGIHGGEQVARGLRDRIRVRGRERGRLVDRQLLRRP